MALEIYILVIAFILDLVFGDPRALPHLIVGYGKSISLGEKLLNNGQNKFFKGAFLACLLVTLSFVIPYLIILQLNSLNQTALLVTFSIVMLFYCLANHTLIKESYAVFNALKNDGLQAGRKRLSWIVGRDTSNLNEDQIRKATFETMSENLSDGVIAPLIFFAAFGVPGAMAYKMINTLDSMIGYKNERYEQFGKFAAKLDDVANFIPARLTAALMLLTSFTLSKKSIVFVFTEGKKHSSPNAGYPEAALAFILNCQFGGPNFYGGQLVKKPFIGYSTRRIDHKEIDRVAFINLKSSVFLVCFLILFY